MRTIRFEPRLRRTVAQPFIGPSRPAGVLRRGTQRPISRRDADWATPAQCALIRFASYTCYAKTL